MLPAQLADRTTIAVAWASPPRPALRPRPTDALDVAAAVTDPSLRPAPFCRVADMTWAGVPWFVDGDGSRGGTDWGRFGHRHPCQGRQAPQLVESRRLRQARPVLSGAGHFTLSVDIHRDTTYAQRFTRVQSVRGFGSATDAARARHFR
ncbi:hypothetical protein [Streptomyces sp. NBC_00063]|uniref:hypothetical protein n=1 Tax=Streptomyces sp. NBC_00063 TaxID=2975638 RepID=UPI003D74B802